MKSIGLRNEERYAKDQMEYKFLIGSNETHTTQMEFANRLVDWWKVGFNFQRVRPERKTLIVLMERSRDE